MSDKVINSEVFPSVSNMLLYMKPDFTISIYRFHKYSNLAEQRNIIPLQRFKKYSSGKIYLPHFTANKLSRCSYTAGIIILMVVPIPILLNMVTPYREPYCSLILSFTFRMP